MNRTLLGYSVGYNFDSTTRCTNSIVIRPLLTESIKHFCLLFVHSLNKRYLYGCVQQCTVSGTVSGWSVVSPTQRERWDRVSINTSLPVCTKASLCGRQGAKYLPTAFLCYVRSHRLPVYLNLQNSRHVISSVRRRYIYIYIYRSKCPCFWKKSTFFCPFKITSNSSEIQCRYC